MDDVRTSRSVPFPQARPDAVLRYTTSELCALSELLMKNNGQPNEASKHWLQHVEDRLNALDMRFILNALRLGLKTGDHFTKLVLPDGDDLHFAITEATQPISDAVTCAVTGRSYADLQSGRVTDEAPPSKDAPS